MCLIILNLAGEKLPPEHIVNGWERNSDGAGYMFAENGKLIIRKPFYKLKELTDALAVDHARCGASSPFVIHFRYATHGERTEENCHPHAICGGQVGLAHNGVLSDFLPPFTADYSDTVHFCRTVMAYRAAAHVMDETFRGLLEDMIGMGNKFVMLRESGEYSIVNEKLGQWDGGNWYSNSGYKTAPMPIGFGTVLPAQYRRQGMWDDDGGDVWDKNRESAIEELNRLEYELDAMDAEGFAGLTIAEQDAYIAMYNRTSELERELDSRLH